MKRLKNSTKKFLGVSLLSLCFFSFIANVNAVTMHAQSYNLYKGTVVGGNLYSTYSDDGNTLDIRARKRGWLIYYFQNHIHFNMEIHKYDQIMVYFTTVEVHVQIPVYAVYTDDTSKKFMLYDGNHTLNIDGSKYLDYICILYGYYTSDSSNQYIYIDLIAAVPV